MPRLVPSISNRLIEMFSDPRHRAEDDVAGADRFVNTLRPAGFPARPVF